MKILLATDGSDCSLGAAQFLSRFHCSSYDEITVLYVIPSEPLSDEDGPPWEATRNMFTPHRENNGRNKGALSGN